ncbi:hypothetical protein Dimus_038590 [Dionaea muscipula]
MATRLLACPRRGGHCSPAWCSLPCSVIAARMHHPHHARGSSTPCCLVAAARGGGVLAGRLRRRRPVLAGRLRRRRPVLASFFTNSVLAMLAGFNAPAARGTPSSPCMELAASRIIILMHRARCSLPTCTVPASPIAAVLGARRREHARGSSSPCMVAARVRDARRLSPIMLGARRARACSVLAALHAWLLVGPSSRMAARWLFLKHSCSSSEGMEAGNSGSSP